MPQFHLLYCVLFFQTIRITAGWGPEFRTLSSQANRRTLPEGTQPAASAVACLNLPVWCISSTNTIPCTTSTIRSNIQSCGTPGALTVAWVCTVIWQFNAGRQRCLLWTSDGSYIAGHFECTIIFNKNLSIQDNSWILKPQFILEVWTRI